METGDAIHPRTVAGTDADADAATPTEPEQNALLHPPATDRIAPERYTAVLETSAGKLTIDVRRSWAPRSADRFYTLLKLGYYDGLSFYRVRANETAEVGIHDDPEVERIFRARRFDPDKPVQSHSRGMVGFVQDAERPSTQLAIDLVDNPPPDRRGTAPLGRIRELDVALRLYAGYGDTPPRGKGPSLARVAREGKTYLTTLFPKLDYIKRGLIVDEKP